MVKGAPGSGISTLFSHWISNNEQSLPNACILYHVADIHSAYSIDPVHILRRFLVLLHNQDSSLSPVSDIVKDFPRMLDRACNKHQNGVIIVIDGIDLISNYKESFKWLLDPQPVFVRVIVSVAAGSGKNNHPKQWSKWNSLVLGDKLENTVKLCQLKLSEIDSTKHQLYQDVLQLMLKKEHTSGLLTNHLYRKVFFALLDLTMSDAESQSVGNHLLACNNLKDLFVVGLNLLETRHDKELLRMVLSLVTLTENGLSLAELSELSLNDSGLLPLLFDLESLEIVGSVNWMVKIVHADVSI